MDELEKQVLIQGLETLIHSWGTKNKIDPWVTTHPEFIESLIDDCKPIIFKRILDKFKKMNPSRLTDDVWRDKFLSIVSKPSYEELIAFSGTSWYSSDAQELYSLYLSTVSSLKEQGDVKTSWKELYTSIMSGIGSYNKSAMTNVVPEISLEFFKEDPEAGREIMYNVEFKTYKSELRTSLYCSYIKAGLVDKKIARRIRSDGSEYTSNAAIKCFLENMDLYQNPKEILTQFVDIKHESAQTTLAQKAPDYLVPYMMGFESYYAKKHLELRSVNISKAKELKNG